MTHTWTLFSYLAVFRAWSLTGSKISSSSFHAPLLCPGPRKAARSSLGMPACVLGHHPPQETRLVLNEDHPEGLFLPWSQVQEGQCMYTLSLCCLLCCIGFKDSRLPLPKLVLIFLSSVLSGSLALFFFPSRCRVQSASSAVTWLFGAPYTLSCFLLYPFLLPSLLPLPPSSPSTHLFLI